MKNETLPTSISDAEHSSVVEGSELAPSQAYPGWPPAVLQGRGCELPQVGLPYPTDHEKASES